jgi:UPF0755 protein
VSPVNSDDSSGAGNSGAGRRPLTRKEIRAQEKSQATQSQDIVPPQAYQTGRSAGDETPEPAPPRSAAPAQQQPAAEPPAQPEPFPEAVHRESVQHDAVHPETMLHDAVHPETMHQGAVHQDAAHPDAVQHEYAGMSREETLRRADELQYGYDRQQTDFVPGYVEDDGHHGYDTEPEPLLAGASSIPTAKAPSKKVRRRRRFLALLLTLAVFVVAIVVGAQFLKPLLGGDTVADYPGPGTGEVTITVPPGAGPKSVAAEMQSKQVIASADSFLKQFTASGGALSPGNFTMRKEMNNSDAVAVLLNKDQGKVMYFALSAGMRIGESLQAIADGTGVPVTQLKALSDSPAQFGVPAKAKNLEGFLFPGEYRFPIGTPAKDVLSKLVGSTLDELKAQGVTDPAKQYEAVTVASIVQAEGGQAEYGDVAGAIYNRLKPNNTETNGLIQSDATVTYGLGIRSFHIDEAQKADKSNPYNTYANPGLPAGPIGSPGKTAIDAAAKPKTNDYLYWVTINLDTKETKFSKTLAEHNGYVAKYNAWCDANPGRCV